jgi:hypothetical protein
MSTLERHCQLLLRVYPAPYREVRGEEIIGTLVGLLAVVPLVPFIGPQSGPVLYGALLFMIAAISIAWAVIDARPAIAISAFFLALWLPAAVTNLMLGFTSAIAVPDLVTATAVGVAALWLMRRQSAHPGRPTRTP